MKVTEEGKGVKRSRKDKRENKMRDQLSDREREERRDGEGGKDIMK